MAETAAGFTTASGTARARGGKDFGHLTLFVLVRGIDTEGVVTGYRPARGSMKPILMATVSEEDHYGPALLRGTIQFVDGSFYERAISKCDVHYTSITAATS